ncbi:unnamed protein product [Ixodes pacificus]
MEMRTLRIVCAILLGLVTDLGEGRRGVPFECNAPPSGLRWCLNERDYKECTSVVKELCERTVTVNGERKVERLRSYTTLTWEPGVLVRDHCDSIPSMTAVANFFGPGGSYDGSNQNNGHAAIFIRCLRGGEDGTEVYDQSRRNPLEIRERGHMSSSRTSNGSTFYTIDINSTVTPLFNQDESAHPCRLSQ